MRIYVVIGFIILRRREPCQFYSTITVCVRADARIALTFTGHESQKCAPIQSPAPGPSEIISFPPWISLVLAISSSLCSYTEVLYDAH